MKYPVENLLREATEVYSGISLLSLALLAWQSPHLLLLSYGMGHYAALSLSLLAARRLTQAWRVKSYHRRLIRMPFFALSTVEIPLSRQWLFLGRGFLWLPSHTQRLQQIKQVENEAFLRRSLLFRRVRRYCREHEKTAVAGLLNNSSRLNPFRPDPDVGGKPYLHGLGNEDKPVYLSQSVRVGHTLVLGTTRVGKTRLASILINQDIRNGDAVIVVDPKGDLELTRDMYSACVASGRLADFRIVHLAFPELSASYNPLKNFDQVSEVATRITAAIAAEGEGKQFSAFAWKYINIIAICLEEMQQPITYKSIDFYKSRLDQLLMAYADTIMPKQDSYYLAAVEKILTDNDARIDKYGNPKPPMDRAKAVAKYIQSYISDTITAGKADSLHEQILIDLFDAAIMDKSYYDKITASVGPVLSEINKSNAACIFSFKESACEIELMDVIKNKKVIYIGLDSLTNPNIAQAVGKAFLSDLVSTAGKIYKESNANYRLNLHCDELSEIIQDSFIKILNKAGGAGFQVTAYAQTIQDLEVALGSRAKAEVTKGNLNNLIMLRVENEETANVLLRVLPKVDVISHTAVSSVSDTPEAEDGVYFSSSNEDRVQKNAISMLDINDITSLPKGQAFVLTNGGELYKIRIPLPLNDNLAPQNIKSVIRDINQLENEDLSKTLLSESPALAMEAESPEIITTIIAKEESLAIPQEDSDSVLTDFMAWLEKRMDSGNSLFSLESQALILSNKGLFDERSIFLVPEVLAKYQSRSGIDSQELAQTLSLSFAKGKTFYIERDGETLNLLPCRLKKPFDCEQSSLILEGVANDNTH